MNKLLVILLAMALLTALAVTMVSAAFLPADVQTTASLQTVGDASVAAQSTEYESLNYDRGPHLCSGDMGDAESY